MWEGYSLPPMAALSHQFSWFFCVKKWIKHGWVQEIAEAIRP